MSGFSLHPQDLWVGVSKLVTPGPSSPSHWIKPRVPSAMLQPGLGPGAPACKATGPLPAHLVLSHRNDLTGQPGLLEPVGQVPWVVRRA